MLTSTAYEILAILDEHGGYHTGAVSRLARFSYGGNARERSAAVRGWLLRLEEEGYVGRLDDKRPTCWIRTPRGSEAIEGWQRDVKRAEVLDAQR